MNDTYVHDAVFDKVDYAEGRLPAGEYENCTFRGCRMAGADLSGVRFTDCAFEGCDLSMAKLEGTILHNAGFKDCKLLGLKFDSCDRFGFSVGFTGCLLDNSSFFGRKLPKTLFERCRLREVDFAGCDLSAAKFDECDLQRAQFAGSDLRKADFRTAFNYTIDPTTNKVKKARFSLGGVAGLLEAFGIEIENV